MDTLYVFCENYGTCMQGFKPKTILEKVAQANVCFKWIPLHTTLTRNKLLLLFARPRLLASRGGRVNSVPLLGFAFRRFQDTLSGRGLGGAAGYSGARPLHSYYRSRHYSIVELNIACQEKNRIPAHATSNFTKFHFQQFGLFTFEVMKQWVRIRTGFPSFGHRRGLRFLFSLRAI